MGGVGQEDSVSAFISTTECRMWGTQGWDAPASRWVLRILMLVHTVGHRHWSRPLLLKRLSHPWPSQVQGPPPPHNPEAEGLMPGLEGRGRAALQGQF